MPIYTDQLNRSLELTDKPQRIISLVPSQTELLHDLGLEEEVIAITKFCVHPRKWFRTKTRVGGTKKMDLEAIAALQPDLIIANKEENEREQLEWLMDRFPVWISDVVSFEDCYQMIRAIGDITGTSEKANKIATKIEADMNSLPKAPALPTAYFIWRQPWMLAGQNNFINTMLQQLGLENIMDNHGRYPEATDKQLRRLKPELILLSSEPYPFKHRHFEELQEIAPNAKIMLVDGELFSWYGSRLLHAKAYFEELIPKMSRVSD